MTITKQRSNDNDSNNNNNNDNDNNNDNEILILFVTVHTTILTLCGFSVKPSTSQNTSFHRLLNNNDQKTSNRTFKPGQCKHNQTATAAMTDPKSWTFCKEEWIDSGLKEAMSIRSTQSVKLRWAMCSKTELSSHHWTWYPWLPKCVLEY